MYLLGNDGNNISVNKLRDLCNREKVLENWTNKVNTQLKEPDRSDVFNASRASERAREIGTVDYKILICYFVAKK